MLLGILLTATCALGACFMGEPGDLGQGGFVYGCVDQTDPYCAEQQCDGYQDCHLPSAVALGASFRVWFDCYPDCPLRVTSVAPELLSSVGDMFTARREGHVALLGYNKRGEVVDYIHLSIIEPDRVIAYQEIAETFWGQSLPVPVESLTLRVGEQSTLYAMSVYSQDRPLYGARAVSWRSATPDVASLVGYTADDQVEILGVSTGVAQVTVTMGGLSTEVLVTVEPRLCTETCVLGETMPCCPDSDGAEHACVELPDLGPTCVRTCDTSLECYLSNRCEEGGFCAPQPCGDPENGAPGEIDHLCQVDGIPGAPSGFCVGMGSRASAILRSGVCVETGGLLASEPCTVPLDPSMVLRAEASCSDGLCWPDAPGSALGHCRSFCDWEPAYDAAFLGGDTLDALWPCTTGSTCVSLSSLSPGTGLHELRYGLCLPDRGADPEGGLLTCSLVRQTIFEAPDTGCASALGEPGWACQPSEVAWDPAEPALGTLLGTCQELTASPTVALWDECGDATAICPPSSWCVPESGGLRAVGQAHRCAPMCDAASPATPDGSCPALILAGNPGASLEPAPTCVSLSLLGWANPTTDLGALDRFPTRLGLCQIQGVTP